MKTVLIIWAIGLVISIAGLSYVSRSLSVPVQQVSSGMPVVIDLKDLSINSTAGLVCDTPTGCPNLTEVK